MEELQKRIDKMMALKSLSTSEFASELQARVYQNDERVNEVILRQIELEQCVYSLLSNKKPTEIQYSSVAKRLETMKDHLRNPALYQLSIERSNIAPIDGGTK